MPRRRSGVTAGRLRKVGAEIGIEGVDEILANISKKLNKVTGQEAKKVFMRAAMIAVREIRDLAPLGPTGNLKKGVFADYGDPKKSNVLVGMNYKISPHAHFLEYGTVKMRAQPYFRPGITASRSAIAASLIQGMRGLITSDEAPSLAPRSSSSPSFPTGGEFL